MKKLLLICTTLFIHLTLYAQEDVSQALSTPFNSGGFVADGTMFKVTASQNIFITGFTGNITGSGTVAVYVKDGAYNGSETVAGDWTLLGTPTVAGNGANVPTFIPFLITYPITAGSTKSFYITGTNTGAEFLYSTGTGEGNLLAADANLSIYEGIGIEYPFVDTIYNPGVWNGIIHYGTSYTPACNTLSGNYNNVNSNDGILFDITATHAVDIDEMYLDFQSVFYGELRIYTRPGTHVGFENDSTGWTYLGQRFICNPTGDAMSHISIPLNTFLNTGNTQAYYIALQNNSGHLNYTNGTGAVGDVIFSDANIQIKSGTGKGIGLFVDDNATPRNFNGSIGYCISTAGVETMGITHLQIYPTATEDMVHIVPSQNVYIDVIEVMDLSGHVVQTLAPHSIEPVQLNMYEFSTGMYLLRIKNNQGVVQQKILRLS
jgi:hypothetical protein